MSTVSGQQLQEVFRQAGVGWYLKQASAPSVADVQRMAADVSRVLKSRGLSTADVFQEMVSDPDGLAAFVQTFAMPMSSEIRAMVWCIVRGASVVSLRYEYEARSRSELVVTIHVDPQKDVEFRSTDLWDAMILRHLGFAKIGQKPLIDGYFAFNPQPDHA